MLGDSSPQHASPDHLDENAIALVGLAGRFPGAADVWEFWENLRNGVESITSFTAEDLERSGVSPDVLSDPTYVSRGAVMDDVEGFDASFFGYHPREATLMDPQQRVFLECAWSALEAAGYDPERFEGAIGVFGGVARNTYFIRNAEVYRDLMDSGGLYQAMLSTEKDYVATRVAFKLDLRGPAIDVQSACSTSGVAVHLASQSLIAGDCDMALAGGARVRVPTRAGYHYVEGGIPSPDGHCRAFDAEAQGCVFGSGVAVLVLRRLEDALNDGDHIHAVLRGSAINNDGAAKAGFTAPSVQGQTAVIRDAMAVAAIDPEDISYVEAHGTGTRLGDPIEVTALSRALAGRPADAEPIWIGSLKTNIGHLDAGAAAAGIIKTALALEHREIPPSLNFEHPSPHIDFASGPVRVNAQLRPWTATGGPRRAGVSAFGLGGTNFHAILEEAPPRPPSVPPRYAQLLVLSARSEAALASARTRLADHLEAHPDTSLADCAYTLQTGRRRFAHRDFTVADSIDEAVRSLREAPVDRSPPPPLAADGTPVTFMFTGQGAQYPNMARGLYESDVRFQEDVDRCAHMFESEIDLDLRSILFPVLGREEWAYDQLRRTAYTQPALFTVEYALARLWRRWGLRPSALIGHSLGEYTAACVGGVFSLEDAIRVIAARGRLMESMPSGAMLAVPLAESDVVPRLGSELSVAVLNTPGACVVAGSHEAVAGLEADLEVAGVATSRLATSHAFHSAMMDPVLEPFLEEVRQARLTAPSIPFISNVTGTWITDEEAVDPEYWVRQLRSTVRFAEGLSTLFAEGDSAFLEVGPGHTLASFARAHPGRGADCVVASSIRHPKAQQPDMPFVMSTVGQLWMAGVDIDWMGVHEEDTRARVPLPTYPFERSRYWLESKTLVGTRADLVTALGPTSVPPVAEPDEEDASQVAADELELTRRDRVVQDLQLLFAGLAGLDVLQISPERTFLELGFDSLSLTQACASIRRTYSVDVTLAQLQTELARVRDLAEHIDDNLPEQFVTKAAGERPAPDSDESDQKELGLSVGPRELPLTDGQQEIFLATQLGDDGSCAFNLSNTLHIVGPVDRVALERATEALVRRHEALRAVVDPVRLTMILRDSVDVSVRFEDLSELDDAERAARLDQLRRVDVATPFDLEGGPLFRATLIRLDEADHWFFLTVHHIVADGWSCRILLDELGRLYGAEVSGRDADLLDAVPLSEYSRWYEASRESVETEKAQAYWLDTFRDSVPVLELPTSRARPSVRTYSADRVDHGLSSELTARLKKVAVVEGVTLFTLMLAGFEALLSRVSGQSDVIIGISAAGQARYGARNLVGHCVNFLPLRFRTEPGETVSDRLAVVRDTISAGLEHQGCSFGSLLPKLSLPRDPSRVPLVSVVFNMGAARPISGFGGAAVEVGSNPRVYENFEIFANVVEVEQGLEVQWTFNTDLFDRRWIEELMVSYESLLKSACEDRSARIDSLPLLSAEQRVRTISAWNDTDQEIDPAVDVVSLFEDQAASSPNDVAIRWNGVQLTYRELDRESNRLAHHLIDLGVGPEAVVGLCVERSPSMLVALLGTLKAGGAYLPLDPDFPRERIEFMLADAGVSLLVTEEALVDRLPAIERTVCLDRDGPSISAYAPTPLKREPRGDQLAYVIYTSGSTGRPKGVQVTIGCVTNFLRSMADRPGMTQADILVAVTTVSFDIAVLELLLPLTVGGVVVIAASEVAADGRALLDLIKTERATIMQATPVTWRMLIEAGWDGSPELKALVGGEALPIGLAGELTARTRNVWNMYGPTETTVWSTCWKVEDLDEGILIGTPIGNTQARILDSRGELVPVGVTGELHIGGAGVARGYLNRPKLTSERFVPDPFRDDAGCRMYRTGDLARYRNDGQIECLGRIDNQLKVRGFRIEPGEIEVALERLEGVEQAAVGVHEGQAGDQRLVGYVVSDPYEEPTPTEMRRHLRQTLPEYMVPHHYVPLDALPLTANGKVDRQALSELSTLAGSARSDVVPPRTDSEKLVFSIWADMLGVEEFGVHDNFFDLGGHSLLALRTLRRIEESTGRQLSPRLMIFQSLGQIAAEIEKVEA